MRAARDASGQAVVLYVAMAVVALAATLVGLGVARATIALADRQAVADVAALSGARELAAGSSVDRAVAAAAGVARSNSMPARVEVPDRLSPIPGRIKVSVIEPLRIGGPAGIEVPVERTAEALASLPGGGGVDPGPGDYPGPFAWRQGRPMRPDVATAFDRLEGAALAGGLRIVIASAWRSSSEQARLFAAHPDPKWVAPPGRSLHRLGTELDLGPAAAYGWLAANAGRFGFAKRYAWEPWHFGYVRSPGSTKVGFGRSGSGGNRGSLQPWVPVRFRSVILAASKRRGVSAALLAAQIRAESDFNPGVVSSAGARGISQLMPDEARRFGVDPFDPAQAIDAQARLMRELLARFAAVPLALAAYNAGAGAVARYGGIPPYRETRAYVMRILAWLGDTALAPTVRLIG